MADELSCVQFAEFDLLAVNVFVLALNWPVLLVGVYELPKNVHVHTLEEGKPEMTVLATVVPSAPFSATDDPVAPTATFLYEGAENTFTYAAFTEELNVMVADAWSYAELAH